MSEKEDLRKRLAEIEKAERDQKIAQAKQVVAGSAAAVVEVADKVTKKGLFGVGKAAKWLSNKTKSLQEAVKEGYQS